MHNYNLDMEREMKNIAYGQPLLLHVCCGPCASSVLERLCSQFSVYVLFYNPNIYPQQEYYRRKDNLRILLEKMDTAYPVRILKGEYDPAPFEALASGLEEEPEGGARCERCFEQRLMESARRAAAEGITWFCTTLTVSPHKNAELINQVGQRAALRHRVRFLPSDFKKRDGYKRSIELSAKYGLYRQDYCGCEFSKRPDGL